MLSPDVARFEPRSATSADWAELHAFRRRRHAESPAEEPFEPDHLVEIDLKREHPHYITELLWTRLDGHVVGFIELWVPRPGSPGYESQQGILWYDLYVLRGHRRRGVARNLLPALLDLCRTHQARVLGTSGDEVESLAAVESFGFKKKSEARYSRLDLSIVDWGQLERWADEGPKRSPGRTLQLYVNGPERAEWADYTVAITELFNTIPFDDEEHGDFIFTPETMADQVEHFAESESTMLRILVREADGRITALTEMVLKAAQPEHAQQWLTAVHSSVQGNGIGRWVKAVMLLHLREHHPKVRWIMTDNASSNGPMLKINVDMGFKPYKVESIYQIGAEEFAKAVEERT